MENEQVKLLRDFRIQSDHNLDHNRPDIVVLEKASRACQRACQGGGGGGGEDRFPKICPFKNFKFIFAVSHVMRGFIQLSNTTDFGANRSCNLFLRAIICGLSSELRECQKQDQMFLFCSVSIKFFKTVMFRSKCQILKYSINHG